MKKNNTAAKTAENAKQLAEALKEGTRKTLKDIVNEALEDIIAKDDDEEKDDEKAEAPEDGYEVEDVETDETEDGNEPEKGEGEEDPDEKDDAEDEWSEAEEYKVGDNDFDLTNAPDNVALKFYNKLGDDDQIVITPDGDGKYEVEDKETGAEYVVELDKDAETEEAEEPEDDAEIEVDLDGEEEPEDDAEIEVDLDGEEGSDDDADIDIEFDNDEDKKDELDEDKQFVVDNYQKGDAIEGLTNQETADPSSTISADKGVPTGTERPYGKKGEGEPFEKNVNECGDITAEPMIDEDGSGLNTKHAAKKSTNHINRGAQNQRNSSEDGEYKALRESAKKIYEKAKLIQEENQKYKAYIATIKKSLMEAAVLNVSLGHMVKLMSESTTTKDEKKEIIERFGNVKTINESRDLYREMKARLNESVKQSITLDESAAVAPKQTINETTIYGGKGKNPSLDLMERMDGLGKYNEKFC